MLRWMEQMSGPNAKPPPTIALQHVISKGRGGVTLWAAIHTVYLHGRMNYGTL